MFLLLLLSLCLCADVSASLKEKIKKLQDLTDYTTFYELFGLKENASDASVRKAFRRLHKAEPLPGLTQEQHKDLVMNAYTVLHDYRDAYRKLLGNNNLAYFEENLKPKSYVFLILASLALGFILLDAVIYGFRYLKYMEEYELAKKDLKKNKKPGKPTSSEDLSQATDKAVKIKDMKPPAMVIAATISKVKSLFH